MIDGGFAQKTVYVLPARIFVRLNGNIGSLWKWERKRTPTAQWTVTGRAARFKR